MNIIEGVILTADKNGITPDKNLSQYHSVPYKTASEQNQTFAVRGQRLSHGMDLTLDLCEETNVQGVHQNWSRNTA